MSLSVTISMINVIKRMTKFYSYLTQETQRVTIVHISIPQFGTEHNMLINDRPKNHKLGRERWILLHVKFSLIPFSGCREEIENA